MSSFSLDHGSLIFPQDADEEINPNELDIGFHDEGTAGSTKEPPQPTRAIVDDSDVGLVAGKETVSEGPHRQPQGGETNFFAQPGILAGELRSFYEKHKP